MNVLSRCSKTLRRLQGSILCSGVLRPVVQGRIHSPLNVPLCALPCNRSTVQLFGRRSVIHDGMRRHLYSTSGRGLRSTELTPISQPFDPSERGTKEEEEEGGEEHFSRRARGPPRWYKRPVVWILGFMPVLTFTLGVWQVKRLRWKLDLIDELESKLKREPLSLPKNVDLDVLSTHYTNRLFALQGSFYPSTPANTVFLGPRVREGQAGYHVLQSFERKGGGGRVIVDRGFVAKEKIVNFDRHPSQWRLNDAAAAAQSSSESSHLLLLPRKKDRNNFTPANDPKRHIWYFADVEELVEYFDNQVDVMEEQDHYTPSFGITESVRSMLGIGVEERQAGSDSVLPIYFEEIFEGNLAEAAQNLRLGIPVGRAATVELRNQHAVYAATWFSLSAATSVMLALLLRRVPK